MRPINKYIYLIEEKRIVVQCFPLYVGNVWSVSRFNTTTVHFRPYSCPLLHTVWGGGGRGEGAGGIYRSRYFHISQLRFPDKTRVRGTFPRKFRFKAEGRSELLFCGPLPGRLIRAVDQKSFWTCSVHASRQCRRQLRVRFTFERFESAMNVISFVSEIYLPRSDPWRNGKIIDFFLMIKIKSQV